MKKVLLLLTFSSLLCIFSGAHQLATPPKKFLQNFNLSFQWFELGATIPLKQDKLANLQYGLDKQMYDVRGGQASYFFAPGIYFRDKIGLEVGFAHYSFETDGSAFRDYMLQKYPNHYGADVIGDYYHYLDGFAWRICYRYHFKHFFIEPKFQIMFNNHHAYLPGFRLKEMGSNQYIAYTTTLEMSGPENSYHILFNIARRLDPFKEIVKLELGLQGEFLIIPVHQSITVWEHAYGDAGITNKQELDLLNPAFSFRLSAKLFFIK